MEGGVNLYFGNVSAYQCKDHPIGVEDGDDWMKKQMLDFNGVRSSNRCIGASSDGSAVLSASDQYQSAMWVMLKWRWRCYQD